MHQVQQKWKYFARPIYYEKAWTRIYHANIRVSTGVANGYPYIFVFTHYFQ